MLALFFCSSVYWLVTSEALAAGGGRDLSKGVSNSFGDWGRRWGGSVSAYVMLHRRKCRLFADRCLANYDKSLLSRPIATKMATGAIVEVLGDLFAQKLESGRLDYRRSCAVCLDGILTGLVLHHVYGAQDKCLPPSSKAWWVPFCHIAVDECFVDPSFVAGFIAITDCDWQQFMPTLKASKLVALTTLPVQWLNFRFSPLRYRVLVVNLIDFAWSASVSYTAHKNPARRVSTADLSTH